MIFIFFIKKHWMRDKMKIAYLLSTDPHQENGVNRKVKSQTDAWRKAGNEIEIFTILVNKGDCRVGKIIKSRVYHRKWILLIGNELIRDIRSFDPQILYFRYELFKPFLLKIFKEFNTIVEINSDDIKELKLMMKVSIKHKLRNLFNLITRKIILKRTSGIVSVTNELIALKYMNPYSKPSIVIPNSINLNDYKVLKQANNIIPHLCFMNSSNYKWHGLEKVLQLARATEDKLFIHIIGNDGKNYEKINNVKFYGYKAREEYEKIISKCDIGISSLSLHKTELSEACSLKLREYLAFGLPSIIGYSETAFYNGNLPEWILQLPNNELNIISNIEKIIDFCYKYKNFIVNKELSKNYISSEIIEYEKIEFFKKIIKEI